MSCELFELTGKNALITGSSRGLGLAMARGLAAAGAHVILSATNQDLLEQRRSEFAEAGHGVSVYPFDVTEEEQVAEAVSAIEHEVGPLHVLVNNAGITRRGPLDALDPADWQEVIDINLTSVWRVSRHATRAMVERRTGKVINIASLTSFAARPTTGAYTASKGAVAALTRAMAVEWTPYNVQVNAIAPGYFATDLTAPLVADEDFTNWVKLRTPANRWGDPAELVGPAVFLASDASNFVSGQVLYVDGGWTANL